MPLARRPFLLSAALLPGMLVPLLTRAAEAETSEAAAAPPERFALLIGINDYQYVPTLDGCVNDVNDWKKLLVEKFQFPPDAGHILTLTNAAATRDGILQAFRGHLIANAEKHRNAIVVFVYSGHGSLTPDPNGIRASGKDATIVPVDSRDPGGKHLDIAGKELGVLLLELGGFTENMTFVLDSCHSESGTRGVLDPKLRVREVEPDRRDAALAAARLLPRGPNKGVGLVGLAPPTDKYVTIAGCRFNELSQETNNGDRPNGLLSFHLIRALRGAHPETTYRELMETVGPAVTGDNLGQHPQIEGDVRRAVFAGAATREDPFIPVTAVEDRMVILDAGAAQGIRIGTLVALYPPEERILTGDAKKLTTAVVKEVRPFSAIAELPDSKEVPLRAKAVLIAPALSDQSLRVRLDAANSKERALASLPDPALAGRLTKMLEKSSIAVLTRASAPVPTTRGTEVDRWDVAVVQGVFGMAFQNVGFDDDKKKMLPAAAQPVHYLAAPDGAPLFGFFVEPGDPEGDRKIVHAVETAAGQRNVRALQNRISTLQGGIEITMIRVQGMKQGNIFNVAREDPVSPGAPLQLVMGDFFRLQIKNTTATDLNITLLDLSTDGSIAVLYPPNGANEILKAGKAVNTPVFESTGPTGSEVYKVIATTQARDFSFLEQGAARGRGKGIVSPLELLALRAVQGTRGTVPIQTKELAEPEEWTTAVLEVGISERAKK